MAQIDYHKLRMIVADDFGSFRATVAAMLNKLGVSQVEAVSSGKEVLQLCQAKRYDVVLCDYDLGTGKNGQQVLEELRYRNLLPRSSLFVIVTADTSRSVVLSAYDSEPDDYLMKPVTALTLEQRLNRLLRLRSEMMPIYRALDEQNFNLATTLLSAKATGDGRASSHCQKLLGELFLQLGEATRASSFYENLLRKRDLDWARFGLAKAQFADGRLDDALATATKLLDNNSLYLPAHDLIADIWRAHGNNENLQQTLQQAVAVSPMSILRQQKLGDAAADNQDLAAAVKAYRRSIKLGQLSCHARAADNLGFARAVAGAKEKGMEAEGALAAEALLALNTARERFDLTREQALQAAAVQGRVQASLGRTEDARASLAALDDATVVDADLQVCIDFVAGLRNLGDHRRADKLVTQLLNKYRNDQWALEQLDILLDEPASDSNRQYVTRINREGIELYEQKRFDDAVAKFEQATRLFPNNTRVQLNMAQALLGLLRVQPEATDVEGRFAQAMEYIQNLVPPEHAQYGRFNRIKSLASKLSGQAAEAAMTHKRKGKSR